MTIKLLEAHNTKAFHYPKALAAWIQQTATKKETTKLIEIVSYDSSETMNGTVNHVLGPKTLQGRNRPSCSPLLQGSEAEAGTEGVSLPD